ncbi:Putative cytosolic protein [Staphylococcus simiae]|nr:Putative cytosolic protein [Staphylococcus simiae]
MRNKIKGAYFFMDEQQTIDQIKTRLNKFIEDIDHVNPDEVRVEDIDEWIGLLDQLEEKMKQVSK